MEPTPTDNQPGNPPITNTATEEISQPVFWQLVVLLLFMILVFGGAIYTQFVNIYNEKTQIASPSANPALAIASEPTKTISNTELKAVPVTAKAALVWDIDNEIALYDKDADEVLPLASITKLMTTLIVHEVMEEKESITIPYDAVRQLGDSGLSAGESFELTKLNDLTLMTSSNDGAYALAEAAGNELMPGGGVPAFVAAMNIRAEQLGFTTLHFDNPTGLDLPNQKPGAVGSPKDVAKLLGYIVTTYPEILTGTTETQTRIYDEQGLYHDAQNTNHTVSEIEGLIGSKTGYTDLAGGNLAIAFNAGLNRPIAVVVLGSTRTERFTDVLTLTEETKQLLAEQ